MRLLLFSTVAGQLLSTIIVVSLLRFGWHPAWFFDFVRDGRYMGLTGDPNILAVYTLLLMVWLTDETLFPRFFARARWGAPSLLALASVQILLTQSRSGWFGCVVALSTYFFLNHRAVSVGRMLTLGLIVLTVFGAVLWAVEDIGLREAVSERVRSILVHESAQEEERFHLYYTVAALKIGIANPFGTGPGMTSLATGIESLDGDPIGAHNSYVQIMSDNGWLALCAALGIMIAIGRSSYVRARANAMIFGLSSRVVFASLLGIATVAMFQDLMQWRMAWLVPALALIPIVQRVPRSPNRPLRAGMTSVGNSQQPTEV